MVSRGFTAADDGGLGIPEVGQGRGQLDGSTDSNDSTGAEETLDKLIPYFEVSFRRSKSRYSSDLNAVA